MEEKKISKGKTIRRPLSICVLYTILESAIAIAIIYGLAAIKKQIDLKIIDDMHVSQTQLHHMLTTPILIVFVVLVFAIFFLVIQITFTQYTFTKDRVIRTRPFVKEKEIMYEDILYLERMYGTVESEDVYDDCYSGYRVITKSGKKMTIETMGSQYGMAILNWERKNHGWELR